MAPLGNVLRAREKLEQTAQWGQCQTHVAPVAHSSHCYRLRRHRDGGVVLSAWPYDESPKSYVPDAEFEAYLIW